MDCQEYHKIGLAGRLGRTLLQALARAEQNSVSAMHWFGKDQRQLELPVEQRLTCWRQQIVMFVQVRLADAHSAGGLERDLWQCLRTWSGFAEQLFPQDRYVDCYRREWTEYALAPK